MSFPRTNRFASDVKTLILAALCLIIGLTISAPAQNPGLTPLQQRIERERQHLASSDVEERRDALMRLGLMKRPEASRVAVTALSDPDPTIRVAAAHAIESLPGPDAVTQLTPLLQDKLEFVRREAAYALGETRSPAATGPLTQLLTQDKESSVRAAAAHALGRIRDESAVPALVQTLLSDTKKKKKSTTADNEFLRRSAAQALGAIGSRSAVAPLMTTVTDETNPIELRRVAAKSLGEIGDPAAVPALQTVAAANDPYLARAAHEALLRLRSAPR
jgi:HEAT repeat protein